MKVVVAAAMSAEDAVFALRYEEDLQRILKRMAIVKSTF
jgi:hypothetical protein